MSVAVVVMARDEERIIGRCLESGAELADALYVLDTGSSDRTPEIAERLGATVEHAEWAGFGSSRTRALELTRGHAWTLMVDADQEIEHHPDLRAWLLSDRHPEVDVFMVETRESGTTWRMPRLTRGGIDWRYEGATHEWLVNHARSRPLLGLTLHHHGDGSRRPRKHEEDLELLAPAVAVGDPRATYYAAQALHCIGRDEEAAEMYERRAGMGGWEEEAWHARYMAARIRRDVPGLLAVHAERPWRHEPLTWGARIVAEQGARDDVLFLEAAAEAARMPA